MYTTPRGTRDILPEDQRYWRYLEDQLHRLAALFGYEEIETPIFEETPVFARGIGEATDLVEKEMYTFSDNDTSLTLRPEFTAGVVRAYIEHGMKVWPHPVKLYSIGPAFRRERPQAGRYRQLYQFNAEAIGEQDPTVDLEIMSIAWELYSRLGLMGLSFQLNSTGCPECRPHYVQEILIPYLEEHVDELSDTDRDRLERNPLRVLDSKDEMSQPIVEGAPSILDYLCEECEEHFRTLREYLDLLGRPYQLNHRLVRGLDYYTKTVFEVWAEGIGAQNALCGGGRYDGLAEVLGGEPTPGVGFAAGLDRIILTMKEQGIEVPHLPSLQVFVAYLGEQPMLESLKLLKDLREAGVEAASAYGDRSLKAQMREADRQGAKFTVIIGERELEAGKATVRHMADSEQWQVDLEEVVDRLRSKLGD